MLIRGQQYVVPGGETGIHLRRIGRPLVMVADCDLHLHRRSKVTAGPIPPNVSQYCLKGRSSVDYEVTEGNVLLVARAMRGACYQCYQ